VFGAVTAVVTPDFDSYRWMSLERVTARPPMVRVHWADGTELECFALWLYENTVAIDPITRESRVDPFDLPHASVLVDGRLGPDGELVVQWVDGTESRVHPGWLRSIADERHLPDAVVGQPVVWDASIEEPPTFDGVDVGDDDSVLEAWLSALVTHGLARLRNTPTDREALERVGRRIGPIRGSNFGDVFTVEATFDKADSLANTGANLGQHADLPTRETPPGFQFLHCVENTVAGGASRMTDGLAVVEQLQSAHSEHYEALTTLEWVFANRAKDGDHRWIGPLIDHGARHSPITMRAFYPVRLAPHMSPADVPRAYAAMRVFSKVAHDPELMLTSRFEPGDLVGFDNRRVLHGRDAFDPGAGRRVLRGCYIDRDDVLSRLRVLRRRVADGARPHS
jgi:gamma-butyrobetaine dioxygenase